MGTYRRLNVASGRPLEARAHYSRALRVGDTVLQAGTTATDREGRVRGVGDAARQVEAIMAIAEASMGKAGGRLEDVVRSRIYVTDMAVGHGAISTVAPSVSPGGAVAGTDGAAVTTGGVDVAAVARAASPAEDDGS